MFTEICPLLKKGEVFLHSLPEGSWHFWTLWPSCLQTLLDMKKGFIHSLTSFFMQGAYVLLQCSTRNAVCYIRLSCHSLWNQHIIL